MADDGLPNVEDLSGSDRTGHDYGTGSELNSLASSTSRGSLDGPAASHDEPAASHDGPLAPAPEPLTSDNLGDLTAHFAAAATRSGESQPTAMPVDDNAPTSVYSMGLVIPDAPSVASGEYAQPVPPPDSPQEGPYPFPEGEIYSENYFKEKEYRAGRVWWTTDPKICPHLRIYGTCGDSDRDVPPDAFKRFGSEVCLQMWARHRPCHAYTMVTVDGRSSFQKEWWVRSGIEAKKYKPKRVCPLVGCGPCGDFRMKHNRHRTRCIEDAQVYAEYWNHRRRYLHGVPLLHDLERRFQPDDSESAGKLCWLSFPFEIREIIYDLLLVNRHYYSQREHNIQIADDQGPHHLVFHPKHLRVELGNTPWDWPCVDGRYEDVEHNPCAEGQHYPCTGIWPAILRTNKRVLAEASWILYSRNTFEVSLSLEASGDPWYNLYGKHEERRTRALKGLGPIINNLYRYPDPEPLITLPSHTDDDPYAPLPSEPESVYGASAGSDTDSDNLSTASSEEQDFRADRDPLAMPSWLSRLRLAAFLRRIGGRNASQLRTVFVTAFDAQHVHAMLPVVAALFRQHTSRLTTVHFQLFRPVHGEDSEEEEEEEAEDARRAAEWARVYAQLVHLARRVGSVKEVRYHGHFEFGAATAEAVRWQLEELDEELLDRRNAVEKMPQLEVHRWFLARMMVLEGRGVRVGPGGGWWVGRRWVGWVDAQREGGREVLGGQLCLPYLGVGEEEGVGEGGGEVEGEGGEGEGEGDGGEEKEEVEVGVVEVGGTPGEEGGA